MKRYVAKMMKRSLGPTGADLYRGAPANKRSAIGKIAMRKWRQSIKQYLPSDRPAWCPKCLMYHNDCGQPAVSGEVTS